MVVTQVTLEKSVAFQSEGQSGAGALCSGCSLCSPERGYEFLPSPACTHSWTDWMRVVGEGTCVKYRRLNQVWTSAIVQQCCLLTAHEPPVGDAKELVKELKRQKTDLDKPRVWQMIHLEHTKDPQNSAIQ